MVAHPWFTFDNAAGSAGLMLSFGVVADGYVLDYWLYRNQEALTPEFIRLTLFGLLLVAMAVQIGLSALLVGTTSSALPALNVRKRPGDGVTKRDAA